MQYQHGIITKIGKITTLISIITLCLCATTYLLWPEINGGEIKFKEHIPAHLEEISKTYWDDKWQLTHEKYFEWQEDEYYFILSFNRKRLVDKVVYDKYEVGDYYPY